MNATAVMLKPINHGWAITLTDGRELGRFTGFAARRRALAYLANHDIGREAGHARRVPKPTPRTYFVGRRPYEAPEVYAVTEDDVTRLRPTRHDGPVALDWHAGDARALALSRVLLTSVACDRPPRDLEERFALEVLEALPDDGFVLESDAILRWLDEAWDPGDSAQLEPPRRSRLERLRAAFRCKTNAPITDG